MRPRAAQASEDAETVLMHTHCDTDRNTCPPPWLNLIVMIASTREIRVLQLRHSHVVHLLQLLSKCAASPGHSRAFELLTSGFFLWNSFQVLFDSVSKLLHHGDSFWRLCPPWTYGIHSNLKRNSSSKMPRAIT